LGRRDRCWLLATVEDLLSVVDSTVFWRRSRVEFHGMIALICTNGF